MKINLFKGEVTAIKKLILLLIVLSALISGCLDSGEDQEQEEDDSGNSRGSGTSGGKRYEKVPTPEETITSGDMEMQVGTETLEEIGTPDKTETAGKILIPGAAGGVEEEKTEKTGNHNFSVNGHPNMRMTITVK